MIDIDLDNVWPEWKIVREIGRGSYGVVYEAVRQKYSVESHAAIKVISIPQNESEVNVLRSEGMSEDSARTYLENVVNDFSKEIALLESFKGIQNIVSVEDYEVVEKKNKIGWDIYIRMELLTPFDDYICDRNLTESEVIKLGVDICTALEFCAKKNVIHRDIKPGNIFVNQFGDFKLGDFGIARKLENVTGALSYKGTYNYMAPEIPKGLQYDATVDQYSLGLVLYQLMNRQRLPFMITEQQSLSPNERTAANQRRINGEPLPVPCDASPAMVQVILRACAPDAKRRFPTATEMKNALISVANGTYREKYCEKETALDRTERVRPVEKKQNRKPEPETFGKKKKSRVTAVIAGIFVGALLAAGGVLIAAKLMDNRDSGFLLGKETEAATETESEAASEAVTTEVENETETEEVVTEAESETETEEATSEAVGDNDIYLTLGEEFIIPYEENKVYELSDNEVASFIENDRTAYYQGEVSGMYTTILPRYFDGNTNLYPYLNLTSPSNIFYLGNDSGWTRKEHKQVYSLRTTLLPVNPGDDVIWTGANALGPVSQGGNGSMIRWGVIGEFGNSYKGFSRFEATSISADIWYDSFRTDYMNPRGGYYGGKRVPNNASLMSITFWTDDDSAELYIKNAKFGIRGTKAGVTTLTISGNESSEREVYTVHVGQNSDADHIVAEATIDSMVASLAKSEWDGVFLQKSAGGDKVYIKEFSTEEKKCTVTFFTDYGECLSKQVVRYNEPVEDPGALSADEYTFSGWYTREGPDLDYGEKFDFSTPIKTDLMLYATWSVPQILIDCFKDKKFVVYGDSISTLAGETPTEYDVFYNYERMEKFSISRETTWWGMFINHVQGEYWGNYAWNSSLVGYYGEKGKRWHSAEAAMANYDRINAMGQNGDPDVILFYGGINDLDYGVEDGYTTIGTFDSEMPFVKDLDMETTRFDSYVHAFVTMINRLKNRYPDAEIIMLLPEYSKKKCKKETTDMACEVMIQIAEYYDIPFADMRSPVSGLEPGRRDYIDKYTHPSNIGFQKMAQTLQEALVKYYSKKSQSQ